MTTPIRPTPTGWCWGSRVRLANKALHLPPWPVLHPVPADFAATSSGARVALIPATYAMPFTDRPHPVAGGFGFRGPDQATDIIWFRPLLPDETVRSVPDPVRRGANVAVRCLDFDQIADATCEAIAAHALEEIPIGFGPIHDIAIDYGTFCPIGFNDCPLALGPTGYDRTAVAVTFENGATREFNGWLAQVHGQLDVRLDLVGDIPPAASPSP